MVQKFRYFRHLKSHNNRHAPQSSCRKARYYHGTAQGIDLRRFTIHPLFTLVLVVELLFNEALKGGREVFSPSIRQQHTTHLHAQERFRHLKQENIDLDKEATLAFGNEQRMLGLLEKMEFAIKMGKIVMSWFADVDAAVRHSSQKDELKKAGDIIFNRFEYLVDGLEFQMLRLHRARSHS